MNGQKHEGNENGGVKIKPTAMVQEVARGHTRSVESNRVRGLGGGEGQLPGGHVWLDGGARR